MLKQGLHEWSRIKKEKKVSIKSMTLIKKGSNKHTSVNLCQLMVLSFRIFALSALLTAMIGNLFKKQHNDFNPSYDNELRKQKELVGHVMWVTSLPVLHLFFYSAA